MSTQPRARDEDGEPSELALGERSNADETQVALPGDDSDRDRDRSHWRSAELRARERELRDSDEAVEAGTRVGRYMILDVIGSGGVGVVFAAYDPDLDRKVALKQLRRSKLDDQAEAVKQRRSRLHREAQALARLSHPNVVPVYEVAAYDDQLYVVMEFVEGQSLGEWLSDEVRSWSEIIAMFVQVGRGLAAAHAADIVHRDFKPDNVRVGVDGRARVLDFGLAAPLREGELEHEGESLHDLLDRSFESDSSWSDHGADEVETREGQVMGTPAYMPPEQATGARVDARSDQFSFCVALYEALYGRRPFSGRFEDPRRFRDLSRARKLPGQSPVEMPIEIERALIRGLSLVPEQRFASMDALLVELTAVTAEPRRLWWVPATIVFLAMLAVIAFYERRTPAELGCGDGRELLVGVWDSEVVDELGAGVAATGEDYGAGAWARSEARFDAWAAAWSAARVRACEATRDGQQTPALLDRRMACLDRQLTQVEGILAGLRHRLHQPRELLDILDGVAPPNPDDCAGATLLDHPPLDPSEAEAVREGREIRAALAEVEGLTQAGDYGEARKRGELALADAKKLGFAPIEAEAMLLLGLAMERQEHDRGGALALIREAAWIAQGVGHLEVVIRAAAALAMLTAGDQAELEAARVWAALARSTFERYGDDPSIEVEVRRHLGEFALTAGDYDAALSEYRRARTLARVRDGERSLAYINALRSIGAVEAELGQPEAVTTLERARTLAAALLGPRHPMMPEILDALGSAEMGQDNFHRALELHRAALELTEELLGPTHARAAVPLNNLAIIYDETGRYDEAVVALERAREILVTELGADHPKVAYVDVNLGSALQNLDRYAEALTRYEAALVVLADSLGPEHMAVGVTLQNLATVRAALGDYAGALDDYDRAAEVLTASFGDSHPTLVSVEKNRAEALAELDRDDEALAAARRAMAMTEAIWGPEHGEQLVSILTTLSGIELELGNRERARDCAERAVELCSSATAPGELASAHFGLAKLLARKDRERARALAEQATRALARAASGHEQELAEIRAWLDAHG